jgi:hypothetical protein
LRTFIVREWGLDRPPTDENERVTVIAHSMGGLIARRLVEGGDLEGFRWIKRLITVGTPHLGAPAVYTHMLGTSAEMPLSERLLSRKLQRQLALRLDSLAEMLPVFDFVARDHGGGLEPWRSTLSGLALTRHPAEGTSGTPITTDALTVVSAFRAALIPATRLQAWLAWRRVQYLLLGGRGLPTTSVVREGKAESSPDGDATVPYRSGLDFGAPTTRDVRSEQRARSTLRAGMRRHPPLRNTFWLERQAFSTEPESDAVLANEERLAHDDAMKIASVGAEISGRLSTTADEFTADPPPAAQWSDLFLAGQAIAQTLRTGSRPQVLCVARMRLGPLADHAEPPLPYAIGHCGEGHRPAFPLVRWRDTGECLEVRLPQSFSDVVTGARVGRTEYGKRFVLMDRQADADAFHPSGGAILIDEGPSFDDIVVVTWNTGEMSPAQNRGNAHHAEAHLVGWWLAQDKAWRDRLVAMEIIVELSPCSDCCADLRQVAGRTWGRQPRPPRLQEAVISWMDLYRGARDGRNATTLDDLAALEDGAPAWSIAETRRVNNVPFSSPRPARAASRTLQPA